MWIVRLALRRPYTIAVMCFFVLLMGILSIKSMLVDIFPTIDIPVVSVVWNYNGLSAEDMERRVILLSERAYSTTVSGITRIESSSIPSIGLLKIYFEPGSDIGGAIAQISSVNAAIIKIMPPGIGSPAVVRFNASNVPVAQLTMSSKTMSEEQIFDYGLNFVRISLFTIPGLSTPAPYGGKGRLVTVDVDPKLLAMKGLSAADVVTALNNSNSILPAGTARIGETEYNIAMNASPGSIEEFNDIPIKVVNGAVIRIADVAKVSDGFNTQTNIVHVDGKRSTYLAIIKKANASTLEVVSATKDALPAIKAAAPNGLDLSIDFDQSVFVRSAIDSVLREGVIAAILVSIMILFFLGSWRSVIIVCTSIPLAIMVGVIGLNLTGNSLNIMTLGGLSLAIGMLVDDATVEVENIHRNSNMGKPLTVAILDGAQQIAVPAIMATLSICIVFFPVVLLTGPSKFLFTPMALSVVISMIASYLLSRTLVPTLARMLMKSEHHHGETYKHKNVWSRINDARERGFDRFQEAYGRILELFLHHRTFALGVSAVVAIVSIMLVNVVGTDFFPTTDSGLMKMHFRAPVGTRLEETERIVLQLEDSIKTFIPRQELARINDQIGVPTSYNLSMVPSDNASGMDAEILLSLKPDHHPSVEYMKKIRKLVADRFGGCVIYFQPADIMSQVLNFGLPAPIDIQIQYPDLKVSHDYALKIMDAVKLIPGAADVALKQVLDYPSLRLNVDRQRAAQLGLTVRDVANSMLVSLSSSALISPSFFLNPKNNVNYNVSVKVPLERVTTMEDLLSSPITPPTAANLLQTVAASPTDVPTQPTQRLGNLVNVISEWVPNELDHYTVQRVLDVTANVEGRDLGSTATDIQKVVDKLGQLPKGMKITIRGQNEVMTESFRSLGLGIIIAIVLVYLLMVTLFQSWLDPFIVMVAVPGSLCGILWMLTITGTTINVISLMGAIMSVGIAVSNSTLLVSFANDVRVEHGYDSLRGALEAGKTRLRPVLMTALAMILGMIPMALGLGEGGEQNAPLGRAVIGGLIFATFTTLFIVPVVYSLLRKGRPTKHELEERFQAEEKGFTYDPNEPSQVVVD
ncbi:MAG: efflux RND transporter permease subunit [Bacteroidetes bacterium]|nr:efflux RND transporter permease subunit [Bacteroidota bacterium]